MAKKQQSTELVLTTHLNSIIADATAALELLGGEVEVEETAPKKTSAGKANKAQKEEVKEEETAELDLETLEGMDVKDLKKVAKDAKIAGYAKMDEDTLRASIAEFYGIDLDGDGDDEDLEDLEDDELVEKAEELEVEPVYTGKGKKKALDREATIAAIQEALEEDGDGEDGESYSEEDLEEMEDEDLLEVAEECGVDPVYTGKGKAKKLDRDAVIAAIIEYQEEEADGDGEEDGDGEDTLEIYEEEDLDELDEEELKEHLEELAEAEADGDFKMPKNWKKISGKAKLKKAILEVYVQLEDEE